MRPETALQNLCSSDVPVLYMAMDVGPCSWQLAISDGEGDIRTQSIGAGNVEKLHEVIERTCAKLDVSSERRVVCCYEAGRDGFSIYRQLMGEGILTVVIDPGSLPEPKKGARAKTDRIDAERLVREFVRYCDGHDEHGLRPVHPPKADIEDARHLFREHEDLLVKKIRETNQIRALLKTQGIESSAYPDEGTEQFRRWLTAQPVADDFADPGKYLTKRLIRGSHRLEQIKQDIEAVVAERDAYLEARRDEEIASKTEALMKFDGIGAKTAFALVIEMFGWREFNNRREVGAYVGLDPQRYDSGQAERDQSITRKGNNRLRRIVIQMARNWLNFQPDSELTEWARRRFGSDDGVSNRGVVALGRKLLNRLRIFLETGEVPNGARVNWSSG